MDDNSNYIKIQPYQVKRSIISSHYKAMFTKMKE